MIYIYSFLNQQTHFNDQESPIDCDEGEVAGPSNRTKTTTVATVNTNLSESSQENHQPSKSKTNAETQTALRGVALMEMIQRSSTTTAGDDIENAHGHTVESVSGASRNNKVLNYGFVGNHFYVS